MDDQRTERIEISDEQDLHAVWKEREVEYARQRTKLAIIVGCTIFGVFLVWTISMGDTVKSLTSRSDGAQYEQQFLNTISAGQQKLAAYSPKTTSTAASTTVAATSTISPLLNTLKEKAQNLLSASTTTR